MNDFTAVPERLVLAVPLDASLCTVSWPVAGISSFTGPAAGGGAKITPIVQDEPEASADGQLLDCVNGPVTEIELMLSGCAPVLLRVTCRGTTDVVPIDTRPKSSEVGDIDANGPEEEAFTTCVIGLDCAGA